MVIAVVSAREAPGVLAAEQPGSDFADAARPTNVMPCVPLAVAALLWFFPLSVASKLLPTDAHVRPRLSPDSEALLDTGLFLLWLWLLALALAPLILLCGPGIVGAIRAFRNAVQQGAGEGRTWTD